MDDKTTSIHVRFHKDDYLEMAAYDYLIKNKEKYSYSKMIAEAIHYYLLGNKAAGNTGLKPTNISKTEIDQIAMAVIDKMKQDGLICNKKSVDIMDNTESNEFDEKKLSSDMFDFMTK